MSIRRARKSNVKREFLSETRLAQASVSAACASRASTSNGSSEIAFCSRRKDRPSISTASRAGLIPRTSFQNSPLASSRATVTPSFWNASSRPTSSPSTVMRKGKSE